LRVVRIRQDQVDRRPAAVEILVGRFGENAIVFAVGGPFDEKAGARGLLVARVGAEKAATIVGVVGAERGAFLGRVAGNEPVPRDHCPTSDLPL
jgi:hypothetical protein